VHRLMALCPAIPQQHLSNPVESSVVVLGWPMAAAETMLIQLTHIGESGSAIKGN
jgi:hypothetical protein